MDDPVWSAREGIHDRDTRSIEAQLRDEWNPMRRLIGTPEQAAIERANIIRKAAEHRDRIMHDPFMRQMARDKKDFGPILSPRDVIFEQLSYFGMLTTPDLEHQPAIVVETRDGQRWGPKKQHDSAATLCALALDLEQAVPILWTEDMHQLATSSPLPDHVIAEDLLPFPHTFMTNRVAYVQPDFILDAYLLSQIGGTIVVASLGSRVPYDGRHADGSRIVGEEWNALVESGKAEVRFSTIRIGSRYPQDISPAMTQVLQLLSFLASPYVDPNPLGVDERVRKAAKKRHGITIPATRVRFVKLRALAPDDRQRHDLGSKTGRKVTVRFQVRAHHRRQWMPSLKGHQVRWIHTYFKGPADAPLRITPRRVDR